ncbi:Acyl-coenzyme A oxidase 3, peroxisomal [Gracilariopsis chorda]|uniref:Acyl-coenzyme A oxidase n=1 Tax=Gracilariopsis chorda TaxID=448386 RepID=A0A2V3J4U3_9FLOR|nr:Acyl-coenzyme A oxidase 3, peroxisomal [Gracilariopsis chorda]|eukprot:PXF49409.1 Acyl-coenzyme A oxidase 3, peroxisomal [Gracilariopsis chorda]
MVQWTPNTDTDLPSCPSSPPSPDALNKLLFPTNRELREKLFDLLKEPLFRRRTDISVRQHRELTTARIKRLHQEGVFRNTIALQKPEGSRRYDNVIAVLTLLDHSLEVKLGVSFGLFGATVHKLGSKQQRDFWIPRLENFEAFGCFALTELGHGSNVRGIETRATYLPETRQFEIHTPNETAQKYWIGGAADSATHSVVFAKLTIRGIDYGIHVFIVRLRRPDGTIEPGIRIADCGEKAGLNGVDNGRIWFTHVRIPREDMLSGLSQVAPDGTYSSSIPSANARFGVMLAALTGGRVGIASNAIGTAMLGLTIAIRYSFQRRAFAPSEGSLEVPLLFYTSQQRQLMIPLATSFVYGFCARDLSDDWYRAIESGSVSKRTHVVSAGYKALFTWFMQDALQAAREACGGQGYKSDNVIAPLKADRDVMLTFEGANTVMMLQVGKTLLAEFGSATRNSGRYDENSILSALNAIPRKSGSTKQLDSAFFRSTFLRLEKEQVVALGNQYSKALKKRGGSEFHAWNDCLEQAEKAARAHMCRVIHETFECHVKKAYEIDEHSADALGLCGQLWGANSIQQNADFLRLRCISINDATVIAGGVGDLCEKMTAIAKHLVEGIGIPQHLLAPIAVNYVKHNSRARL